MSFNKYSADSRFTDRESVLTCDCNPSDFWNKNKILLYRLTSTGQLQKMTNDKELIK